MSTTAILVSFLDAMELFASDNSLPMARPGMVFDPPDSGIWIEALSFPGEPRDPVWDNDGCSEARGFFQVAVYYRPTMGQVKPSEVADNIIEFFGKGTPLAGVRVYKKPWQSPAVTDEDKLFIPVTIPYSGLIK